jgi:receptor protein-tyrosine kinase
LFGAGVEFIDVPEFQPTSRLLPAAQFGLAAAAFGMLLAGAIAWLAALRRPVVAAPDEAAAKLRSVLLGQLDRTNPQSGYDLVATNAGQRVQQGVVVVTASSDTEAGNTDLVVQLADAWIREGRSVLVIDGNVRRPRLSMRYAAGPPRLGFTDLLGGLADERAVLTQVQVPNGGRMCFVPCGRSVEHPASLLRSATAQQVLAGLRQRYDVVLVDAPPIMDRAEGGALASVGDGLLVVVPQGEQAQHLDALRNRIEVLGVSTYGVVYDLVPA